MRYRSKNWLAAGASGRWSLYPAFRHGMTCVALDTD
jgi:hypothetical protein